MKIKIVVGGLLAGLFVGALHAAVEMPASSYINGLKWLGHASFRWAQGGKVVYFDPWKITAAPHDADMVFISHPHFDHLQPEDVAKVSHGTTTIVTVEECAQRLRERNLPGVLQVVEPGEKVEVQGVPIEVMPAYNLAKTFHLKGNDWVGFLVELNGIRLYYAGDTDFVPEMKRIQADVVIVPVSGMQVMTAEEAARAVRAISPRVAVPMHYGAMVGSLADAKRFQKALSDYIVEILPKEEAP